MSIQGVPTDVNEHIQGAAEFVEQHGDADDDGVATALAEHVDAAGLDRPSARGNVLEVYRAIVQRIRGRHLVKDLGEHEFSIDWLSFHIPQGGKGRLKISSSEGHGYGVKLSVLGLGFGSGFRRTFTVEEDFHERTQCLTLGRRVRARLRTFADHGKENASYVQVDVVAVLAEERTSHDPCHECSGDDADELHDLVQLEPTLDLRHDKVGQIYQQTVKIEGDAETEFGLSLPILGLEFKPSLSLKRSTQLQCDLIYDLPGGFCYTPFQRVDGWNGLPIWRRI